MYNIHNYLVNFCRASSGHWIANRTLEPFVRSSWQQEILEVARPAFRLLFRTVPVKDADFSLRHEVCRDIDRHAA